VADRAIKNRSGQKIKGLLFLYKKNSRRTTHIKTKKCKENETGLKDISVWYKVKSFGKNINFRYSPTAVGICSSGLIRVFS